MKKFLKYGLLTLLVLVLIGGVAVVVGLDSAIKVGTQKGLQFSTQCETKLDKASLSLLSGNLTLSGLDIKNPAAFDQTNSFVKMGTSEVQVQPKSLLSEQIEVDVVNLDGLELGYVRNGEGKDNVQAVLDSVNRLLPKTDDTGKKEEPKEKSNSNKKIHVALVKFTNAKIHANVDILGAPIKVDVPLPDFTMSNIQVAGGMPELTAELVQGLSKQLIKQIPEIIKAAGESAKGNLKDLGGETVKQGKDALDAIKGIKNPFKK